MKFRRDGQRSADFRKPCYTYTVRNICYMLLPEYKTVQKKDFRRTGKAWWYVKAGRVDIPPCLRSARMLTIAEACAWAERELFPTRLALLFDDE